MEYEYKITHHILNFIWQKLWNDVIWTWIQDYMNVKRKSGKQYCQSKSQWYLNRTLELLDDVLFLLVNTYQVNELEETLTRSPMCDSGVCHHRSPPRKATLMTWNILSLLKASNLLSLRPLCNSTLNWCHQLVHHCSGFMWFPASIRQQMYFKT